MIDTDNSIPMQMINTITMILAKIIMVIGKVATNKRKIKLMVML